VSDPEEYTYHPDVETDVLSSDDVGLNCIRPAPSTNLSVIKCSLSTSRKDRLEKNCNLPHSSRLETSYKMIVDSESYLNTLLFRLCENLRLENIPTPHPFNVYRLTPRHLRLNNILSQSVSIIIKTRFGVT